MVSVGRTNCVERARALIGARFRPQGRSAEIGLDCIGLAMLAYGLPQARVRADYRLHGGSREEMEKGLAPFFDRIPSAAAAPGDLLLVEPGARQLHLIVLTPDGYVHADARLRRVVEASGAAPWPLRSAWRYSDRGTD